MPSSGQPEPAHVRRPLVDALSFVWAIVPIVSFGFATSLVFAFAAYRMRSRAVAIAAACYLAVPVTLIVTAPIRDFATDDWQNQVALWTWVAGPWFGGTVYALIIRRRVFPLGPTGPQTMRSSSWNPWRDSVPPLRNTPTRPLAGPAGIAVPLSYVWALVPLLTLGFATCLTIGSAAVRLRSRTQGMAAAGYVLLLAVFVVSNEPIRALTITDWRAQAVFWGWSLTSWWGGTFHAFYLRQAVFTRRRIARPISVDSRIGVIGPYQLLSQLGQGGQGTVYLDSPRTARE
ncbi:hypothetical protein [Streptosporangium sp. NPDC002721]|uniref:hypothetical protein n=1 Tax=Streptosporangium sp. NPDC002721 TaxID=3366188 RepID=UPI0036A8C3D1